MKNRTGELREEFTIIMSGCYSQELSACPKHPIFQPQKAINQILKACKDKGLAFMVDRELPHTAIDNPFLGKIWVVGEGDMAGYKLIEGIEIEENTD